MPGVASQQGQPEQDDAFPNDGDVDWQRHAEAAENDQNDTSLEQNGQGKKIPFFLKHILL